MHRNYSNQSSSVHPSSPVTKLVFSSLTTGFTFDLFFISSSEKDWNISLFSVCFLKWRGGGKSLKETRPPFGTEAYWFQHCLSFNVKPFGGGWWYQKAPRSSSARRKQQQEPKTVLCLSLRFCIRKRAQGPPLDCSSVLRGQSPRRLMNYW